MLVLSFLTPSSLIYLFSSTRMARKCPSEMEMFKWLISLYELTCIPSPALFTRTLASQRRGWEPEAILNWLSLSGWGARREFISSPPTPLTASSTPPPTCSPPGSPTVHAHSHVSAERQIQAAPDSTTIMSLNEMISQFDLDALTHRSTSLDPGKLEYINKQHLMRVSSTPEGLHNLAERVHEGIKTLFPHRSASLY